MLICVLSPATLAVKFHLSVVPIVLLHPMLPCRVAKNTGFGAVSTEFGLPITNSWELEN